MLDDDPYAYAKACGIIGKSFIGKRISSLGGLHNLSELNRLLFPDHHNELPGRELLADLEHRIIGRAVHQILVIVNSYMEPPEFLIRLLRVYEYGDLKVCLQHIATGKKEVPLLSDIGRFKTVRFEEYPNIAAMIHGTEFEALLAKDIKNLNIDTDFSPIEAKLDKHYYLCLAESLSLISAEDRESARQILADEISLRNCAWALRLRSYFQKTEAETGKYLMDIKLLKDSRKTSSSLAAEAFASLEFPLDSRQPWKGWRWEKFLNPEDAHGSWIADPRYFQNAASQYMYRQTKKGFHRSPMSFSAIFCYIKIKQFEEDLLTSVAEGLALGMDSASVIKMLEVA